MLHHHVSVRPLCSLFTAASLALSLGVTGYAETQAREEFILPAPQTADDPQYGAEYQKYYGEPEAEELPTADAAAFSLQRSADTFEYTSPYTGETYTVTGSEENLALGVDVSYYQDEIDWAAAKADGVEFAFIRAAYRGYAQAGTLVTDTQFYNNLAGARDQDIKVGIYIYSQAATVEEAREEAEYVLALIDDYKLELPIIFDQEFAEQQTGSGTVFTGRLYDAYTACATDEEKAAFLTDLCLAFCETIEEAGYTPMIYASTAHFNRMDMTRITDPVWVAQYSTSKVRLESPYAFWQYSASGTVAGIPGKVDCNFSVDPAYLNCHNPDDAETTSRIVISPESYPKGVITAKPFSLTGSIISALPLTSVSAQLLDGEGKEVQSCTDTPLSDTEYIIKGSPIDNGMKFASLTPGTYTLRYTAVDQAGTTKVWESEPFTVSAGEDEPSQITITPESYPQGDIAAKPFPLTGTITSAHPLTSVSAVISRADGSEFQGCREKVSGIISYEIKNSGLDKGLRFADLTGGYYYLTYSATDTKGTTQTWQSDVFAVAEAKLFPDVTDSSKWFYSHAYKAASLGLISGVGTSEGVLFCPNDDLTRAQIVCMLYRAAGSPAASGKNHPFTDAKASWYQTALNWAYETGVVSGTSDTTFSPDSPVTREQMAVMLYKLSGAAPAEEDVLSTYTDAGQVSSWAATQVNWSLSQGLLSSVSVEKPVFSPKTSATRAQAAVILSNYVQSAR